VNLGLFCHFGGTAGDTFLDPTHPLDKSNAHVVDQVIGLA
jgi:hypothetical protein